jgi:hypothetical protein
VANFKGRNNHELRTQYVESQRRHTERYVRLAGAKDSSKALTRLRGLEDGAPAIVQGWEIDRTDDATYVLDGDGTITPVDVVWGEPLHPYLATNYRRPDGSLVRKP